jgi:predicted GNAT family N-acyltransferase
MAIADYAQYKLENREQIKSFECTDRDLNDFLFDDALDYHKQLMGVTYLWVDESNDTIVAYYTLFNDKITKDDDERSAWNRISRPLPNQKRRKHYPAVKIGRLAVNKNYERRDIGRDIITFLKVLFTSGNRTGCRFITVDAYRAALQFYEKCGFSYMTHKDKENDTRLMYFDLKGFLP